MSVNFDEFVEEIGSSNLNLPTSVRSSRDDIDSQTESGRVIISNSEVTDFLKCERKHYYAHSLRLRPKTFSTSLSRGIIGHEALAEYYSNDRNPDKAFRVIDKHAVAGTADLAMLGGLRTLIGQYFEFYADDSKLFDILEVENAYYMDIGEDYSYGMRLDLLAQYKSGPYMGEKVIYDHKFQYDFTQPDDLTLNVQLPKYIGTLRNSGHDVKRGVLNQLRWRETKDNKADFSLKFRRDFIAPSAPKIRNIMREQVLASEQIADRKSKPIEIQEATALRSINTMTCKNCSFTSLCATELDGQDSKVMIATEFVENDYGYGKNGEE